ncbi:MAG TPA: hypothetical protein VKK79_19645 [Candidatus Lokiarchaeia archaeon]|nr:hypothetical protein [Candidatus Lokiarchaeia archaeon]
MMHKGDISRSEIGTVWKEYVSGISCHIALGIMPEGADEVVDRMIKTRKFWIN